MGLYSTVINSYQKLGSDYLGDFQTKDLVSLMDQYWISPNGELFRINYHACFYAIFNENPQNCFDVMSWQPTGLNGCITPCEESGVVRIYTSRKGVWKEADLYFKRGRVSLILDQRQETLAK